MIFNGMKRRWMRKQLEKKAKVDHLGKPLWPKHLRVVFDKTQWSDPSIFYHWAKELGVPRERVLLVGAVMDVKKEGPDEVYLFDRKSIKWSGGFKDAELKEVLARPIDMQISCLVDGDLLLEFMACMGNAQFHVGCTKVVDNFCDLTISGAYHDHELFPAELKKYLTILIQE